MRIHSRYRQTIQGHGSGILASTYPMEARFNQKYAGPTLYSRFLGLSLDVTLDRPYLDQVMRPRWDKTA